MSLENAKLISFEGARAIGLKDSDKNKLAERYVSSFTVNEAVVEPVPEAQAVTNAPQQTVGVEPTPQAPEAPNIFDNPNPGLVDSTPTPVNPVPPVNNMGPTFDANTNPSTNIFDAPIPDVVQTSVTPEPVINPEVVSTPIDTPQDFFNKTEASQDGANLGGSVVEDTSEDPLITLMKKATELVNTKNATIKALNDKIIVLEEQLRVSEEARKLSESQKMAAETTLANARMAASEDSTRLVYQNPTNGGNMAA